MPSKARLDGAAARGYAVRAGPIIGSAPSGSLQGRAACPYSLLHPSAAQEMRRRLGSPVPGERALEVHSRRAACALASLEVGEVPDMHPGHERPLAVDVEA